MFKFQQIAALAFALFLVAPHAVLAQPYPPEQKDPIGVYVEAGATAEQQQKIRHLAKEFETNARIKIERAGNLMRKMQQFSLEPNPEEKVVLATQEEINGLQAEMANSRIKLMLNIRTILTGDQRQRLVELLKERKSMQGQGM